MHKNWIENENPEGLKSCQEPRGILRVSSMHMVIILWNYYFQAMIKLAYAANKYWYNRKITQKKIKNSKNYKYLWIYIPQ